MLKIYGTGFVIGENTLKLRERCWKAARIHYGKLTSILRIGNQPDRQGSFDHPALGQEFESFDIIRTQNDVEHKVKAQSHPVKEVSPVAAIDPDATDFLARPGQRVK
jgi:hypothetical protein